MNLGKLSYVDDLRIIWGHEEKNFTPWLAENITLLGSVLGLDLEVVSVEHDIGAFSLDILAKDTTSGHFVAIENQLEITDHNHLGQILTYASGVDARTVIWISKEVREEHQKAIDWLNQITSDDREFFAIEIQLIKVDDSLPAPFFNVKAAPNDWSKEQNMKLQSAENITVKQEYYHTFFTALLERVHKELPGFSNAKKVNYDSWKTFPSGVSGTVYDVAIRQGNRLSCEVYIDSGNKEKNKQRFDSVLAYKDEIEDKLGKLSWERLDNKTASRIACYIDFTNDEEMLSWAINKLKEFKETFKPIISKC
jgi:hypothetical protein